MTTNDEAPASGPSPSGDDAGPRVSADDVRDLRRLRRSSDERYVAGVAGGIARHLDVDPLVVRVALAVLVLFGGTGLLLYGGLWLLVPRDDRASAPVSLDDRSRSVAIAVTVGLAGLALLGDLVNGWVPWPLLVVLLVVALLVGNHQRRGAAGTAAGTPVATGAPYPPYPPHTSPYGPPAAASAAPVDLQKEATAPVGGGPGARPGAASGSVPPGPYDRLGASGPVPPRSSRPRAPKPPSPLRRGPVLFWFTAALAAFAVGLLAVVDLAGLAVVPSAYPALALAVTGVMLLVGAFYGRGGGLILAGLGLSVATAGALAVEHVDGERFVVSPTSASQVADRYSYGAAETVIDLSGVRDPEDLAGRYVDVEVGVGRVEVLLPEDVGVDVAIDVGLGSITLPDQTSGGAGVGLSGSYGASGTAPTDPTADPADLDAFDTLDEELYLNVQLGVGEVVVSER